MTRRNEHRLTSVGTRFYLALAFAAAPGAIAAQAPPASAVGLVTDEQGKPIPTAYVTKTGRTEDRYLAAVDSTRPFILPAMTRRPHGKSVDSTGRFEFDSLEPGDAVLRALAGGYEVRDTTIRLVAGQTFVWNVVLPLTESMRRIIEMRRANGAAGRVDSFATGGLVTDSASALTYGAFGTALLHAATAIDGPDSNRVLSPFGGGQALALMAAGDSTEMAMAGTPATGPLNRRMNTRLRAWSDLVFKVASALWVDTAENLARSKFGAVARSVPLTTPEAVKLLNRWADSTTAGRIPSVRQEPFDTGTGVVLTNAVYLKSTWLWPFDTTRTKPRPFTLASGRQVIRRMMETWWGVGYRRGDGYQAVRLPNKAGLTALYLVLPDSGRRALDVLGDLQSGGWPVPGRTEFKRVHLLLPRFQITQATDLIPVLERMGMGIAFDSSRANFSQHVFFDLNEEGVQPAALTVDSILLMPRALVFLPGGRQLPSIEFVVDRPFLFALRDEPSGAFLLVGYVADPGAGLSP